VAEESHSRSQVFNRFCLWLRAGEVTAIQPLSVRRKQCGAD
jgi:hypothetical protein